MPPGGFPHFSPFGLIRRLQRHDHALAAFGQGAHGVGPHGERGLHLAAIGSAIVDASNAALVAALVVQDLSMMCGCIPRSAILVATARRMSCSMNGATPRRALVEFGLAVGPPLKPEAVPNR